MQPLTSSRREKKVTAADIEHLEKILPQLLIFDWITPKNVLVYSQWKSFYFILLLKKGDEKNVNKIEKV